MTKQTDRTNISQRVGLFIEISEYTDDTFSKLIAPSSDTFTLATVLLDETIGNFEKKDTKKDDEIIPPVLINKGVEEIQRHITRLYHDRGPNDLILLYYSGHGIVENGQLYLAATDTKKENIEATAIPAKYIMSLMDHCQSKKKILILDCCYSAAFNRRSKTSGIGRSVGIRETFEGNASGRVVLTTSDRIQYAWDGDHIVGEEVNSVFTHYLIDGLKTGEADMNNDGKVDIDELYDYVYNHIMQEKTQQTPKKWSYGQVGDIYIARNPYRKLEYEPIPSEPGKQSYEYQASRYGIGYELLSVKCIIGNDGSAAIEREVTVKAFSEIRKLDTYLLISGENRDMDIDIVHSLTPGWQIDLTDTKKELGQRLSAELTIAPPLEIGKAMKYQMREELSAHIFAIKLTEEQIANRKIPYDFFNWNINRPTYKLILEAHFPQHSEPNVYSAEVRYASVSGFPSVRLQEKEQKWYKPYWANSPKNGLKILKLEVDYPMLGLIYGLRWQPIPSD